jgi:hypothetical protein
MDNLVILNYDPSESVRSKHLQKSRARSHAAKKSHTRRKKQGSDFEQHHGVRRHVKANERELNVVLHRPTLHLGPLQHGNSDPFSSASLTVTPQVASLMTQWRRSLLSSPSVTSQYLLQGAIDWDLSLNNYAYSESTAFAASAMILSWSPRDEMLASEVAERKHQCIATMRALIANGGLEARTDIARSLLPFITGLLLSSETEQAAQYAQLIDQIPSLNIQYGLEIVLLIYGRLHYIDVQIALMNLRPPVLKIQPVDIDWDFYLKKSRTKAKMRLPMATQVVQSHFSETLVECYARIQRFIDVQCDGSYDLPEMMDAATRVLPLFEILVLAPRLLRHWTVCERDLLMATGPSYPRTHTEAVICMAAICFLTCIRQGPRLASLQQRAHKCMTTMRTLISARLSKRTDVSIDANARLWALYIGATWEAESGVPLARRWFINCLQQQIYACDIRSWSALKHVADGFLRVPIHNQPGSVLFLGLRPGPPGRSLQSILIFNAESRLYEDVHENVESVDQPTHDDA